MDNIENFPLYYNQIEAAESDNRSTSFSGVILDLFVLKTIYHNKFMLQISCVGDSVLLYAKPSWSDTYIEIVSQYTGILIILKHIVQYQDIAQFHKLYIK